MIKSPFVEYVLEQLRAFEDIALRRMFGGYGIYRRGIMFAIIADDRLFLKTDEENRHEYKDAGMVPFVYDKHDKQGKKKIVTMSYWEVPPHVLESADAFFYWCVKAYDAAVRNKHKKAM